jgi:hypothetical protein
MRAIQGDGTYIILTILQPFLLRGLDERITSTIHQEHGEFERSQQVAQVARHHRLYTTSNGGHVGLVYLHFHLGELGPPCHQPRQRIFAAKRTGQRPVDGRTGQRHTDPHHLLYWIRGLGSKPQRDHTPQRMPHQRGVHDTQLVQKLSQYSDVRGDAVEPARFVRIAKAPQIERISAVPDRQLLHRRNPIAPRSQPAMDKDQWPAASDYLVMYETLTDNNGAHRQTTAWCGSGKNPATFAKVARHPRNGTLSNRRNHF